MSRSCLYDWVGNCECTRGRRRGDGYHETGGGGEVPECLQGIYITELERNHVGRVRTVAGGQRRTGTMAEEERKG